VESTAGAVLVGASQLFAAPFVWRCRNKHYQANASAPIFEELRGLVLKTSGLVDVLRAALAPLAAEIDQAFVYGSVAKGKDTAKSDSFRGSLSHRSQRPCYDCAENLDHRRVVAAQCRMNGRNVVPFLRPSDLAEIQRRQSGLEPHQHRE
jgi:hypothetical protein